jgi:hypothetical protein
MQELIKMIEEKDDASLKEISHTWILNWNEIIITKVKQKFSVINAIIKESDSEYDWNY